MYDVVVAAAAAVAVTIVIVLLLGGCRVVWRAGFGVRIGRVRIGRVDRSISKIPVKRIVVSILRIELLEEDVRIRTIIYKTLCNQY